MSIRVQYHISEDSTAGIVLECQRHRTFRIGLPNFFTVLSADDMPIVQVEYIILMDDLAVLDVMLS